MKKYLLAGATTLAMMSGVALAQSSSYDATSSQTVTETNPPVVTNYNVSKTQKTVEPDGTVVEKSANYSAGANGTQETTSSKTTAPVPLATPSATETTTAQTTAPFVAPDATADATTPAPGVAPPDDVNNETVTTQTTAPVPTAPPTYTTSVTRTTTTTSGQ